jgi:hypothetical protein
MITVDEYRLLINCVTIRAHVTQMHALHRTMYMGERMKYYMKRDLAINEPLSYLSIISDGMAQNHCKLPWHANLKDDSKNHCNQHLQGVYCHGRNISVYRTTGNVKLVRHIYNNNNIKILLLKVLLCKGISYRV